MTRPAAPHGRDLALVALGGNQGDVAAAFLRALAALAEPYRLLGVAPVYRTAPISDLPQDDYLNTVALLAKTPEASPLALLTFLQDLERREGRRRADAPRNGPRPLDLDLLTWGEEVCDLAGPPPLQLPHPRLRERRFVLAPLADLLPDLALPPDGARVADLLAAVGDTQRIAPCEPDPLAEFRNELALRPSSGQNQHRECYPV